MNKLMICLPEDKQSLSILKYGIDFASHYQIPYELILVKRSRYFQEEMSFIDVEMPHAFLTGKKESGNNVKTANVVGTVRDMLTSSGVLTVLEDSADLVEFLDEKYRHQDYSLLLLPHISDQKDWPFLDSLMQFIKEVDCPILLIETDTPFNPIDYAVYASDYLPSDANVINRFVKLHAANIRRVDIIHISFSESFKEMILEKGFQSFLEEQVPGLQVRVRHAPAVRSQETTVDVFLNEVSILMPDLLILMKEQRSGFEELFHKSFTLTTAKKTSVPLLILHEKYVRKN